jgi:hypothetical protein
VSRGVTPILNVSSVEESVAWFERLDRARELGYEVSMPPTDEPWGVREFHLRHPDGHTFRVGCGPYSSARSDSYNENLRRWRNWADAAVSKAAVLRDVWVRVPPAA